MHHHYEALALCQGRARELRHEASHERLARAARRHAAARRAAARQAGFRQRFGRSLVRIGHRLAADSNLEPARSR